MRILVHSHVGEAALANSLGKPEYSYFFVLKRFLPVLESLGEVVRIDDPEREVDAHYRAARAQGEACIFLSFSPPNKAPTGLSCPTLTIFAWEFDTLPNEAWDGNPKEDWRTVLRDHRRAIVLSTQTRDVVRRELGDDFAVAAIPVPVFNRFERAPRGVPEGERTLRIRGRIIDSRDYEITPEHFASRAPMERFCTEAWSGERIELHFARGQDACGFLGGFYAPEPWGTWSRIAAPWIMLPFALEGIVRFSICAGGYGYNANRKIGLHIGNQTHELTLGTDFTPVAFDFFLDARTNLIRFSDLDTRSIPGAADPRTMGLGLRWIGLERLDGRNDAPPSGPPTLDTTLNGVVYTSVLNPADGRKNWGDIVKAFCLAFREEPDATLVLKMTHHSIAAFLGRLQDLLHRVGPTKCRVLALHGYLDDAELGQLMDATTYYVNASHGEGLCMPLMEFMSAGVPAVAPCNTAMADYVTPASTFIVRSSLEPTVWPHDPRDLFRTCYYRIDQESLTNAFLESFKVARSQPQRYRAMSQAACDAQRRFSADEVVRQALHTFLQRECGE
ncbi:hypothetical protein GCM10025771_19980 [Niveibacterium umoris]|uniref:Glycosyltransferase involved in cell wall biosynthesis n=1 Tax=Niveibacterium umoris TaxID=1193620 RepID=A0A840BJL1_9RHOO|nr:glycosyltransferase [Niveibacterium umoris]MBB4012813.1 glycosyltransferase involved in cell wall biosynthesis [Niveibacterium umoris]